MERTLLAVQARILSLLCRSPFSADHRGHMRIGVAPEELEAETRRLVGFMNPAERRAYELFLRSGRNIRQERQLLIKLLIKEIQNRTLLLLTKMERRVFEREPDTFVSSIVRSCVGANDAERWNELLTDTNRVHSMALRLVEISIGAVENRIEAAHATKEESERFALKVRVDMEARVSTGNKQDQELMALLPSGVDFDVHLAAAPEWSWRALWGDTLELCVRLQMRSEQLYSDVYDTFSEAGFLEIAARRKPFDAEAARAKDAAAHAALMAKLGAEKAVKEFGESLRAIRGMSGADAALLVSRAEAVFRMAAEALEVEIKYKKMIGQKANTETMDAAFALLDRTKRIAADVERRVREEQLLVQSRKQAEADERIRVAHRRIQEAQAARTAHEAEDRWKQAVLAARDARVAAEIEPRRAQVAHRYLQEAERGLQAAFERIDREAKEEQERKEAMIRETLRNNERAREAERVRMAQARSQAEALARAQRERERDRERERERDREERDRERESELERERRETERARERREAERDRDRAVRPGAIRVSELNPSYFRKFTRALPSELRAEVIADPNADAEKTIKRARKLSSIKLHPDKGGDPEQFKEMNEAFENLKRIHNWTGVLRRSSKRKSTSKRKSLSKKRSRR
jgi:hypothetical protein